MSSDIQTAMVSKPAIDLRLLPEDILIIVEVAGKEEFFGKSEFLKMLQGCVMSSSGTLAGSSTMSPKLKRKPAHRQDPETRRKIGVSTSLRYLCLAAEAGDFERVDKIIERAVAKFGNAVLKELEQRVRDSELDVNDAAKVLARLQEAQSGTKNGGQKSSQTSNVNRKTSPQKHKKLTALQKRRSSKKRS